MKDALEIDLKNTQKKSTRQPTKNAKTPDVWSRRIGFAAY